MSKLRQQSRLTMFWLVGFLTAAFGLRVHRLGDKRVWWDEGLAAWTARQSLAATANWTAHDVHPPLYFWLLHFWRLASGDSEFGLRLLSVLIGVMTVAAAYLLGRIVGGRKTGLLAALLLTISRFDIAWSQEMRMYALSALWAAIRVWEVGCFDFAQHRRFRDWIAYIFFMTAGLYTLYLSVSVLVVVNLIWLFWLLPRAAGRWREFWRWSAGQAVVLALFAPWLAYALPRIPTWSSAAPVTLLNFVKIYWTMLTPEAEPRWEKTAVLPNGWQLSGYDQALRDAHSGDTVHLFLYGQGAAAETSVGLMDEAGRAWQEPPAQKYKIFTHLLGDVYNADNDTFLWGQQDNEPVNNTRPTTTWRSGEIIVDSYAIPIAAHAPPGSYQIEIGLYDPATGVRLPLQTGADHLVLEMVTVED